MKTGFCYETNIGKIAIVDNGIAITFLDFGDKFEEEVEIKESILIKEAFKQLNEYFEGKRKEFNLPLDPKGTDFQKRVWNALLNIPYGETRTYKEIAIEVGNEKGARAVGMANNKNPISIIIPCHRVIGSNKKLVGYAGGLHIKEQLLSLERLNNDQRK